METMFSNSTVLWTEREIHARDNLVDNIYHLIKEVWMGLNQQVKFFQVETPILTPAWALTSHLEAKFPIIDTEVGMLRPETTAGTLAALNILYPQQSQLKKALPVCLWQHGKSFRNEANSNTMRASKLRLREFYQLEFQLFCPSGTKADYLHEALNALVGQYGGQIVVIPNDDRPHYSLETLDWEIDGIEVSSCSKRSDFPDGDLFEVSIGTDRLLNVIGASK